MASSSVLDRGDFSRISTNVPSHHKIFLCHSGAQKNFVRHLHGELHRVHQIAFFDEDDDSLRKGEDFPGQLFEAARQCELAIVVLSGDFFTRSKWPMLELNTFIEEKKQIFPLFYDLSVVDLKDESRKAEWFRQWGKWSELSSHSFALEDWKKNLEALRPTVGLERSRFDNNDVAFIKEIVALVCKMIPPHPKLDDSHVKGKEFLFSECDQLYARCPPSGAFGARVIGLYGIGGLGKTTLCNNLCNHYYAEYGGKVSIVEFLGHDQAHIDKERTLKSIHHVLRVLTGASDALLPSIYTREQGFNVLKERIPACDVFLAIDNVWDNLESQEEASSFLQLGFTKASRVLVTARNRQTLLNLGIDEMCCFEMPTLLEKDAIDLFLHHAKVSQNLSDLPLERKIYVLQHVYQCYFLKGTKKEFHPLALKVLGSRCRQSLENPAPAPSLKVVEFLSSEAAASEMFPVLKTSVRALREEKYKLKFMDIALFYRDEMVMYHWPVEISADKLSEWLELIHEENQQKKFDQIETLKSKFLLEMDGGQGYKVHELYHEFARHEAQGQDMKDRKFLHIDCTLEGFSGVPNFMTVPPPYNCWPLRRLYVANANHGWSRLNLQYFSNLGLLHLENCCEVTAELKVIGLICLRHLRLVNCKFKALNGLHHLPSLVRMDLIGTLIKQPISPEKTIWQQLQHLHLERAGTLKGDWNCPALKTMVLKDCDLWPAVEGKNLRTLSLSHYDTSNATITLEGFSNLQELHLDCVPVAERDKGLEPIPLADYPSKAMLRKYSSLYYFVSGTKKQITALRAFRRLKELSLHAMMEVAALEGLRDCTELSRISVELCDSLVFFSRWPMNWTSLQEFHVYGCRLLTLASVGPLPELKEISFSNCSRIEQLPDFTSSLALQKCKIFDCPSSLHTLDIGYLAFLVKFEISSCSGLKTLANVGPLPSLKSFCVTSCPKLEELPDLGDSRELEEYEVRRCENLQTLGKLPGLLPALRSFKVEGCDRLVEILYRVNTQILEVLEIVGCQSLSHIGNLGSLVDSAIVDCPAHAASLDCSDDPPALEEDKTRECESVRSLANVESLSAPSSSLFTVKVSNLNSSEVLKKDKTMGALGPLPALRSFKVVGCNRLVDLPDLTNSQALQEYEVCSCEGLQTIGHLGSGHALRTFKLVGCNGLLELTPIVDPQVLEVFKIIKCNNLQTMGALGPLPALRTFKVEGCNRLVDLPDLTGSQALKEYEVCSCEGLQTIGHLGSGHALRSFKIEGCNGLLELTPIVDPQVLEIIRCDNLQTMGALGPLLALRSFKVEGCNRLVDLPDLTNSQALQEYEVCSCEGLQTIGHLGSGNALRSFKLEECNALVELPHLVDPQFLEVFKIIKCDSLQTMGALGPLPALRSFKVEGCNRLVDLPDLTDSQALEEYEVCSCEGLQTIGHLGSGHALRTFKLVGCTGLLELTPIVDPQFLEVFKIIKCNNLQTMGALGPLPALRTFKVEGCNRLVDLPDLTNSQALKEYEVCSCEGLQTIGHLGSGHALRTFKIEGCNGLLELTPIVDPQVLEIIRCDNLQTMGALGPLLALRSFKVEGCNRLVDLPDLTNSQALKEYEVCSCEGLQTIGHLGSGNALRSFKLEECNALVELPHLVDPQFLEVFKIIKCDSLQTMGALGPLPALRSFKVEGCDRLVKLPDLTGIQALKVYEVRCCNNLQSLGRLGPVPALKSFKIEMCTRLVELPALIDSQSLEEYKVCFCDNLQKLGKMELRQPALKSFKLEGCNALVELPRGLEIDPQVLPVLEVYEITSCPLLSPEGNVASGSLTQVEHIPQRTGQSPRVSKSSKFPACQCTIT